jgi:hypothetical protein
MEHENGKQKRQSNPMGLVLKILGGLLLVCIAFFAVTFGAVMFLTQDMANAGEAFMQAIQEKRVDDAYAMLGEEALEDIDSDDFVDYFSERDLTTWSFNSRNVNNDRGELLGTAEMDGETFTVELVIDKVGDAWLINGFNFVPAGSEEE